MPKPTNKKSFYSDLSVRYPVKGSISERVESLSELFTEWFLYDSTTANSLESFIESNGLSCLFTPTDFTDLICGYAYLDEPLTTLVPLMLPFEITPEKMYRMNAEAQKAGGRIVESVPEIIYEIIQEILQEHKSARQERKKAKDRRYYERNRDEILAQQREYYEEHREQKLIRQHERYEQHRDEILAQQREYYEEHREQKLVQQREYREQHRDEILAQRREYYEQHREEILAQQRAHREAHREEMLSRYHRYYQENREKKLAQHHKYYKDHRKETSARHHEYYEEHRKEILVRQRENDKKNKDRDESAKSVCPTYLYLLQMRHYHRADYLKLFRRRNPVGFAIKKCPALQEMDYTKCAFCDGTENPHTVCEMQKMATMPSGIIETMPDFVAIIKAKQQTTR